MHHDARPRRPWLATIATIAGTALVLGLVALLALGLDLRREVARTGDPLAAAADRAAAQVDGVGGGGQWVARAVHLAPQVQAEGHERDQPEHDGGARDRGDRGAPGPAGAGVMVHAAAGLRPPRAKLLPSPRADRGATV